MRGRSYDLAHLAHVELLSPRPEDSLHFFTEVMGMGVSGQEGDSVYLRGWDDYEFHTLKLTASKVAGMGHVAFRATSPEALERRAAIIDAAGFGTGWT
ncbi:VOC family protein, partial [Deinococcus sp.]|uniref:VOC family protein n=1 Tax=Deinococcus sp. TaxID=47478 RepID=UPI00286D895A